MECTKCPDLLETIWNKDVELKAIEMTLRRIVAQMKSNHDTHAGYIKKLEKLLEGDLSEWDFGQQ